MVLALTRDVAEALDLIVELRERKERLEIDAEKARSSPRKRRQLLDSANAIATFAEEMDEILKDNAYGNSLALQEKVTWADG